MDKIFLSVRLTESFFSKEELQKVKYILKTYNNKSEFLRDIIKVHLNNDDIVDVKQENIEISKREFMEVKKIIKNNNFLLEKLTSNNIQFKNFNSPNIKKEKVYNEDEQIKKTEKILGLIDQF